MGKIFDVVNSSKEGLYKNRLEETKKLVTKWAKTGLLDEISNEYELHGTAILLENQAKQLIDEVSKTGTSAGSEEWAGVALPLVRRIFAEISAKEFVSVQPMNLPAGLVFYLDFKYGTDQPGFTTTESTATRWGWQDNSIFGNTSDTDAPTEGLYGSGRYGYTINDFTSSFDRAELLTSSVAVIDVDNDATYSASIAQYTKVTVPLYTSASLFDYEGVKAFKISGSGILGYLPQFTTVSGYSTTTKRFANVIFIVSGTAVTQSFSVWYHKQPNDTSRGDFEATGDPSWANGSDLTPGTAVGNNALEIPEINISLRSEPIVAKTRKLKAVWTPEFAQDLNAYHSIDAENELTGILSEYITMEIDLEILDMLLLNAGTTGYWAARVGKVWNTGGTAWTMEDANQGYALAYTTMTWYQTLGKKMQWLSNQIHKKTMRGGANFAVTSPDIATVIESIPGYAADTDGTTMQYAMGVSKVGALSNKWNIYKNPYMTSNVMLMGFRGTQFLETGAVYSPYIPLIYTPLIYDPTNFTPRKGVSTRYAKKLLRPEFYGKILVSDVNMI